jgi:hypothetical protein
MMSLRLFIVKREEQLAEKRWGGREVKRKGKQMKTKMKKINCCLSSLSRAPFLCSLSFFLSPPFLSRCAQHTHTKTTGNGNNNNNDNNYPFSFALSLLF